MVWDNGTGEKERGIWAAPYDIENYRMLGQPTTIFNSGMRNAASPEAPHLYHIGNYYYLMIAEGGTEHYHSVVVARAKHVLDFYEGNPANPVMTHRMMGTRAKFLNVGHADLVQTPKGDWYAVLLGSRAIDGCYKNLGRETFLCPVEWEWDWPLFSPDTGCVAESYGYPDLPEWIPAAKDIREDFEGTMLPTGFITMGTPYTPFYQLKDSCLRIRCIPQTITQNLEFLPIGGEKRFDKFMPFIGKNQTQFCTTVSCRMTFCPKETESAGLTLGRGNSITVANMDTDKSTNVPGIFAAGDCIYGTKSVIQAIQSGREAASQIDKFLGGDGDITEVLAPVEKANPYIGQCPGFADMKRKAPVIDPAESRQTNFNIYDHGICDADICGEASRCLQCDLRLQISKPHLWADYVEGTEGSEK